MSSKSTALVRALRSNREQVIGVLVQESQLEVLLKAACGQELIRIVSCRGALILTKNNFALLSAVHFGAMAQPRIRTYAMGVAITVLEGHPCVI